MFDTLAESCNNIDYNRYLDKDQLNIIDLPVQLKQVIGKQSTSILKSIDKKLEKINWVLTNGFQLKKYQEELLNLYTLPKWKGDAL